MVLANFSLSEAIRSLVLLSFRRTIFGLVHNLSYSGIKATRKLLSQRWVWPGVNSDAAKWTRACLNCRRSKVQRHTKSPLPHLPLPFEHFRTVHIGLVGPLPLSQGFSYLFNMVDCFTSWVDVVPFMQFSYAKYR